MLAHSEIVDKVANVEFDNWTLTVTQPYSFRTVIEMSYNPTWPGADDEDVMDVPDSFRILYSHVRGEFMMLFPHSLEPRVATPETNLDIEFEQQGAIVHDDFRSVVLELRSGIVHDMPLIEWLSDWIERIRLERVSDIVPGMGPASVTKVYDRFGGLEQARAAEPEMITELSRFLDNESVDALKGV